MSHQYHALVSHTHTVTEYMIPCSGVLSPQGCVQTQQQAGGQVQERGGRGQHALHGPNEALGLFRRCGGEQADPLAVQNVTAR